MLTTSFHAPEHFAARRPADNLSREAKDHSDRDPNLDAVLRIAREYREILGLPLACVNLRSGRIVTRLPASMPLVLPTGLLGELSDGRSPRVVALASGVNYFSVPLATLQGVSYAAIGYMRQSSKSSPAELVLAAAEQGWSQSVCDDWIQGVGVCRKEVLERLLQAATEQIHLARRLHCLQSDVESLTAQLDHTLEEAGLLHALTQNLLLSRSPAEVADVCVQRLHRLIPAEGHAIWLAGHDESHFAVQGRLPFDELGFGQLLARFEDHDWPRPLIKNRICGTLLGSEVPGLNSLILVPISEGRVHTGWMCSCNLFDGKEFGASEGRLLSSIASILGTHQRNIDLFSQHDELLLSFVRTLVSSLDAKDPYTRGHSERVALIARRLGQELQLPEEDLRDIYLSGLLHDIGKIGISDEVLSKPDRLTAEEVAHIQQHPTIGYHILSGLKNLKSILPGVLHHHEAWSGRGYPAGLAGEEIPLMARIIAVADGYDAMGSDRPYRPGMPLARLEEVLRKGAGEQWDANIVAAYFRCRDDIQRLCADYVPTDLLQTASEHEFDHVAV